MNKIQAQIIFFIFLGCSSERDLLNNNENNTSVYTKIGGNISGIIQNNYSPYYIEKLLLIDSGDSLLIEPGVKLAFSDSAMFIVRGTLNCIGDTSKYITFTAFGDGWLGIKFVNSNPRSILKFTVIEKVFLETQDSLQNCAIEVTGSNLEIRNSIVADNSSVFGGGLLCDQSQVIITNNIFRDNYSLNFGGAMLFIESTSQVYNNTIYNNYCYNYGGGLVLVEPVNVDIQNNIFYKNENTMGDTRITFYSGDSTNYHEQYNFLRSPDVNPQFISNEDLHFNFNSPCIDAGNPDQLFNDFDGSRNDQGAYGGPLGNW